MSRRTLVRTTIISMLIASILFFFFSPSSSSSINDSSNVNDGTSSSSGNAERSWYRGNFDNLLRSSKSVQTVQGGKTELESDEDIWVDLDDYMPLTSYDGGIPGYSVFSNLYLSSSTLLAVTSNAINYGDSHELESDASSHESKPIPPVRRIMSAERKNNQAPAAGEDRWRVIEAPEIARDEMGNRAILMKGVTYIFNDPPGGEGYLVYFSHFVLEAFLGATRVLASTLLPPTQSLTDSLPPIPLPKRIWFPRCGAKPSWRDSKGENFWFLSHTLPAATVEDENGWDDRAVAGLPLILEKVVIVDRWSAHSFGGEVGKWGKMNAEVPTVPAQPRFWDPIRKNMMRSLGVDGESSIGSRGLPVVVYVDRQKSKPKLNPTDHEGFVEALKGLTSKAEVHVTKLSSMTRAQQIALMGRTQILVGVHGDEIMNALWMQSGEGSTVIEIFEEGGFVRDFELLASGLNLKYIAIHRNKILDEEGWRTLGSKRGEDHQGEIPVDGAFVASVIEGILDTMPAFSA